DSWCVTITDSGPGIPPEALEQVFEPFFRLARDEHSGIEGNGLGLAICRELVAQLHGEIVLNSTAGQGTSVSLRFPIAPPGMGRPDAGAVASVCTHSPARTYRASTGQRAQGRRPRTPRNSSRSSTRPPQPPPPQS